MEIIRTPTKAKGGVTKDEPALHNAENISELAALIQQTIEDHIDWLKSERKANGQFGVGA